MPRPTPGVNWELIKALFFQGFTAGQISLKTGVKPGTIQTKAARHGWCQLRDRGAIDFGNPGLVALTNAHSKSLVKASQQAQATFSEEITAQASVLASQPPRRLADLANSPAREGRASVVSRLVQTAAKLYGWDNTGSVPTHLSLTRIEVRPSPAQPDQAGQVIDVPYEA